MWILKRECQKRREMWLTSMFKQHTLKEEIRENSMRKKKSSRAFLIHHNRSFSLHPNYQFKEVIQISTQATPRVTKGKGLRYTIHFQYPIPSYFQCWSRNIKCLLFRLSLESLHILNGMTSVLDMNTMAGFKDILQKAAHHSRIKFKLWSMQIQLNFRSFLEVLKSDRINQL